MKLKLTALLLCFMTMGIYAQTKKPVVKKATVTKTVTKTTVKKGNAKSGTAKPGIAGDGIFATIETAKGNILLKLEYTKTPVTAANFIALAEGTNPFVTDKYKGKPFYDGLKFHRVIADFMIQGGDPLGNGSGDPGYKFKDEFSDDKFTGPGVLAMANSGPGTNGSQFFITHKDTPWLNGKHSIFGHVVTGQDVVNKIAQDDVIKKITITRKGAAAKAFNTVKVFSDYYGNKAADEKKAADEAAAKKIADDAKSAPVKAAKVAELAKIKASATTTASGLSYKILQTGTGVKPAEGTTVYIHYAGYLEDGSLFDSSYADVNKLYGKFDQARADQNGYQPFPFQYGNKGGLIPGFLEGLSLMSLGDKAIFFIPANLGYGAKGAGTVIPPNANIIFEVEMLEKPTK